MITPPVFLVIDLFCGAGGTSEGFTQATVNGVPVAQVIACVNHDKGAIKSHGLNHPVSRHYREDIRQLDVRKLLEVLDYWKQRYPDAYVILWASLECTHFSKAKGGKARNADSRTLANHLFPYIELLKPHYIMIENVVEFMAWGPLDDRGKPINKNNGLYWLQWRQHIKKQFWYEDAWQEMNSANYGAATARNRLFGIFAKPGLPILFPTPTHSKQGDKHSLFDKLQVWEPVQPYVRTDLADTSVLRRKKALAQRSLQRLYKGLLKEIGTLDATQKDRFLVHYYGNGFSTSLTQPLPTITTKDRAALITVHRLPAATAPATNYTLRPYRSSKHQCVRPPDPLTSILVFMYRHRLEDITCRMLSDQELLPIQGFPTGYRLHGTTTQRKKFIGNSVVPLVVQRWAETLAQALCPEQTN